MAAVVAQMESAEPRPQHRLVGKVGPGKSTGVGMVFEDSPLAPFLVDAMGVDAPLVAAPPRRGAGATAARIRVWDLRTVLMAVCCAVLGVLAAAENGARFQRYGRLLLAGAAAVAARAES